jgi:hypothetical protein
MRKFLVIATTAALALGSVGTGAFAQPAGAPQGQSQGDTTDAPTSANPSGNNMPAQTTQDQAPAGNPMAPAQTGSPSANSAPNQGAMTAPPPPESANKVYPVCSRTVTDSCRNRGGK